MNIIVLTLFAVTWTKAQAETEPKKVDFCDVVTSPANYDGKAISIEVTLQPGLHSLFLYSAACPSKDGFDVTTQAILPDGWESLHNGKKLRKVIKHGRSAKVQLVGTFRSSVSRGLDGQRFRFSISQINSVSKDVPRKSGDSNPREIW